MKQNTAYTLYTKQKQKKTALANRTVLHPDLVRLYGLRPENGASPILTTREPTRLWWWLMSNWYWLCICTEDRHFWVVCGTSYRCMDDIHSWPGIHLDAGLLVLYHRAPTEFRDCLLASCDPQPCAERRISFRYPLLANVYKQRYNSCWEINGSPNPLVFADTQ